MTIRRPLYIIVVKVDFGVTYELWAIVCRFRLNANVFEMRVRGRYFNFWILFGLLGIFSMFVGVRNSISSHVGISLRSKNHSTYRNAFTAVLHNTYHMTWHTQHVNQFPSLLHYNKYDAMRIRSKSLSFSTETNNKQRQITMGERKKQHPCKSKENNT